MSWLASLARDQRVLLGGLGLCTASVLGVMYVALEFFRDDTEMKPVQPKTQYITQDTEDSLKLGTLDTLLGHYNFAIRETASKIVCDRAVNESGTIDVLLWGITREDYDERVKSLRSLAIITDNQTIALLNTRKAYSALVRSLEYCLPDDLELGPLGDPYFDEYSLRDMAEKLCLMFISQLLQRYPADLLIRVGFIERWLAKQDWTLPSTPSPDGRSASAKTDEEAGDAASRRVAFNTYLEKQNRVAEIIEKISNVAAGRRALEKAGLRQSSFALWILGEGGDADEVNIREDDDLVSRWRQGWPSEAEQRRRHRHREAVVYNDGSHDVDERDIIERGQNSPL